MIIDALVVFLAGGQMRPKDVYIITIRIIYYILTYSNNNRIIVFLNIFHLIT